MMCNWLPRESQRIIISSKLIREPVIFHTHTVPKASSTTDSCVCVCVLYPKESERHALRVRHIWKKTCGVGAISSALSSVHTLFMFRGIDSALTLCEIKYEIRLWIDDVENGGAQSRDALQHEHEMRFICLHSENGNENGVSCRDRVR